MARHSGYINGQLIKAMFATSGPDNPVINPTGQHQLQGQVVLVAAGWKPGFSTDTDAVLLAERFGASWW